jgi:arginine decarboxylase-like protein
LRSFFYTYFAEFYSDHYLAKPKIIAVCCTLTLEESLISCNQKKKDLMEVGMIEKRLMQKYFIKIEKSIENV